MKLPTLKQVEDRLGEKAIYWAGRCYEIASRIVDSELVPDGSRAVYGHYVGTVAPGTLFYRKGIVQHGWILLPDGRIMDPTRWVFHADEPYLFVGEAGHTDYDEGGNAMRRAMLQPCPEYDPNGRQIDLPFEAAAAVLVTDLTGSNQWTREQAYWIANLPPDMLKHHAKSVYTTLEQVGMRGFVPTDNWRMIFSA